MPLATSPPETDLWLPRPAAGETWDPHTVHTHYFGLSVPEAEIGVFVYLRCQPVFGLSTGGVCIFRGLDNRFPLGIEHLDWIVTMPYPEVVDNAITSANGLRIEFVEPGRVVHVVRRDPDGDHAAVGAGPRDAGGGRRHRPRPAPGRHGAVHALRR
jgi:hypothetical protein